MSDCIFCRIASGDIPSEKVYEGKLVIGFMDLNPQAPHHYLLIPKKHIANTTSVSGEDAAAVAELFSAATEVARNKKLESSGFRLVVNQGPHAGQAVFHLHMHLLGGRPMGWPPG